ncbi:MAG: tetratricopeptide repeat protein [Bacteroidia bacterium]|nr:tetratricopeptide repeat protein [Bacteroidia bacterium]
MIKISIPIVLGLCMGVNIFAQSDIPSLSSGIGAFEQEDYETTIRVLARLIETENAISETHLPEAHFYLAQAYYQVSQNPEKAPLYPEALLRAYNHLMASKATSTQESRYRKMTDVALEVLWPAIYNTGVEAYNQKDFNRAVVFFSKTRQINPWFFEAALNQGYSHWQLGDTLAAIKSWNKSLELYRISPKEEHQIVIQETLLTLAGAYSERRLPVEAKNFLTEGETLFPGKYAFHEAEIILYTQHPNLQPGPDQRFLQMVSDNPYDLSAKMALAHQLETSGDSAAAANLFQEIISQKPQHFEANRHLAAYHIRQAIQVQNQANPQESLPTSFYNHLEKALPCLKMLYEIQPDNAEWLRQLTTTASILGLPEAKEYHRQLQAVDR